MLQYCILFPLQEALKLVIILRVFLERRQVALILPILRVLAGGLQAVLYHAFDQDATTEWVSHSNTYKPTTTVIDFSAYIDKTVEYAQTDLTHHYGFLQPRFMCENPRVQATSSNSEFEHQKGSYTANPGGINFWHAGS